MFDYRSVFGIGPHFSPHTIQYPRHFRPTEVDLLLGDSGKARQRLGWSPRITFAALAEMMVDADLAAVGLTTSRR